LKYFFFLQAEDGIRVRTVTGVQTCALPICLERLAESVVGVRDGWLVLIASPPSVSTSQPSRTPTTDSARRSRRLRARWQKASAQDRKSVVEGKSVSTEASAHVE